MQGLLDDLDGGEVNEQAMRPRILTAQDEVIDTLRAASVQRMVFRTVITLPAAAVSDANLTTTITFTAAGQSVALIGGYKGGLKVWAVLQNNGATLG